MTSLRTLIASLLVALLLPGCNTTTVKTTSQTPVRADPTGAVPEAMLLDVGVNIFNPGTEGLSDKELELIYPEVRQAEARYFPTLLATTLQNTGNWGVVRVVPGQRSEMDVFVDGVILQSDGEFLKLQITVQDSSGKTWFTRTYEAEASKYAYDKELSRSIEPFQGLYNRIASDMAAFRSQITPAQVSALRTISELRFAERFAPEIYSGYLTRDGKGRYSIARLPADNDPLMERLRRIRERDNLFVDTLQDHYTGYAAKMRSPYLQWRNESYSEIRQLHEARGSAAARTVGGIAAIAASIAAIYFGANSSDPGLRTLGTLGGLTGIGAGAMLVKSGLDRNAEAKLHLESLKEIAASLDADIQPHRMELEDRTVTLSGTVDQQYAQWREILQEIYRTETGTAPTLPVREQ
ncbi:MAG: hypothetical protein HYR49_08640 [Gammaproteobacteria bacterium]|nr:hypothetical protein [Gammaproteobacteria bacterium]